MRSVCNALLIVASFAPIVASEASTAQSVNAEARAMVEFKERVEVYAELHRKVEATLPKLPDSATQKQIDAHQRDFATRIAGARLDAKVGDLFTAPMQTEVRLLLQRLFETTESRRQLRDSIFDDNPSPSRIRLVVNARYPDEVPLSTMPPDVLRNLPALPTELEYRFVGEHLILFDKDAHIVVDYVMNALPRPS